MTPATESINIYAHDASASLESLWPGAMHPHDLETGTPLFAQALAQERSYSLEFRLRDRGKSRGRYRWHLAHAVPHLGPDGRFAGWIGSLVDIHDAREAASRNEIEFRALADIVPVMMWMADEQGNIDWYNQRWYEYTGQTEDQALGWGWQAVHHPEDLPRVMEAWPRALATGEMFEMEFRLRRFDGVFHTFLTRAVPVRDANGTIVRWYGSNADVQAQREALERTQRVAQTLQRVFLPAHLPHTPKMRVDAVYDAAQSDGLVGGDWLDAVELPDGRYLFSIGDVTGHGLDASVIAGRLRHAIVDFGLECADPALVLQRVNNVLRLEHPDTYATALVAFVDAECTRFVFAGAGHPPPVSAAPGRSAHFYPYGGVPLGYASTLALEQHAFDIEPDSVIVLYTDGITEADRNIDAAEQRLKRAAASLIGKTSVQSPAAYIRGAVVEYRRTIDDTALLVLQFSTVAPLASKDDGKQLRKVWRFHSSDAYSARVARQELMRFVKRHSSDTEGIFATELILGELLANTVEHAPGLVEIDLDLARERAMMSVIDSGPGMMVVPRNLPSDDLSEGGRGLYLIRSLAQDVKVVRVGTIGTQVLVTLPIRLGREDGRLARS